MTYKDYMILVAIFFCVVFSGTVLLCFPTDEKIYFGGKCCPCKEEPLKIRGGIGRRVMETVDWSAIDKAINDAVKETDRELEDQTP